MLILLLVISSIVDSVFCVFTGERERCGAYRVSLTSTSGSEAVSASAVCYSIHHCEIHGLVNLSLTYLDSLRGCCIVTHTALKFISNEVVRSNNRFTNTAQTGCAVAEL